MERPLIFTDVQDVCKKKKKKNVQQMCDTKWSVISTGDQIHHVAIYCGLLPIFTVEGNAHFS